jgi:hypothetical protein
MKTSTLNERQRAGRSTPSKNLGFADRQTRAVIGTLMLATPMLAIQGTLGLWSILMLGAIPVLITAITGWDPLYAAMGKSTYESQSEDIQQRHWTHPNVGIVERGIRLGAGLIMLSTLLGMPLMNADIALALLAIPLIVTAITAWDPLYAAMSVNSFGSRLDVEAAEPGINEKSLAEYYEFPQQVDSGQYPKAA